MPKIKEVTKRYRVLNPNGIPQGIPILSWQDFNWFEGDVLEPPPGMNIDRILREGYIEEVGGD